MPESHAATLKSQLTAEVMRAWTQRPDFQVIKVADGASDNWSYLGETLPFGVEVLDFYHATEHLGAALGAAYGEGTLPYQERWVTLRSVLRDDPQGVGKVIGALERLRKRYPRRQAIHKALAYFREHRHRMRYADLQARNLPIGSGVVEVSRLHYPYPDSRLLSYYWPDGIIKPCRRYRQATLEDRCSPVSTLKMQKADPPDTVRLPHHTHRRIDLCGNPKIGANRAPSACTHYRRMQQGNVSAIATYLTQSGKRRVFRCCTCATHFAEIHETVFFDLRTSEEKVMMALKMLLVRVDLTGISFVLSVTEETVLAWLTRAAQQAEAINHHLLRDLPVTQGQLDEMWNFIARTHAHETDQAGESLPDGADGRQGFWSALPPSFG